MIFNIKALKGQPNGGKEVIYNRLMRMVTDLYRSVCKRLKHMAVQGWKKMKKIIFVWLRRVHCYTLGWYKKKIKQFASLPKVCFSCTMWRTQHHETWTVLGNYHFCQSIVIALRNDNFIKNIFKITATIFSYK